MKLSSDESSRLDVPSSWLEASVDVLTEREADGADRQTTSSESVERRRLRLITAHAIAMTVKQQG